MKGCLDLGLLSQNDDRVNSIELEVVQKDLDPHHLDRRMQQRGISEIMIKIAIAYGKKHNHNGARIYKLGDRHIRGTAYSKYSDKLRGLRVVVVGFNNEVLTVYRDAKWKK